MVTAVRSPCNITQLRDQHGNEGGENCCLMCSKNCCDRSLFHSMLIFIYSMLNDFKYY